MITYAAEGTCATEIRFEVVDGKIRNLEFLGDVCPGNSRAICKLVEGMPVEDAIRYFKGNQCQNGTSCVDQFAKALESLKQQ